MNYEELVAHERDLYVTVYEILNHTCGGDDRFDYFLEEFKKHLKIYEPDR